VKNARNGRYESLIFIRRFALSALIFALPPDTPFRETGLFAVLLLALSCAFLLSPYKYAYPQPR
jgi:hypothetical protein